MQAYYDKHVMLSTCKHQARGYETFFMLNSVEHEILNAHKYKKISRNSAFLGSDMPRKLFFPFIKY